MKDLNRDDVQKELITITTQLLAESGEHSKRDIRMDDSLTRHLRIDSLARAELFQRVEKRYSVAMPDRMLAEAESLQDILDYILEATPAPKRVEKQTVMTLHGGQINADPHQAASLLDIVMLYAEKAPDKPHIYFQHEDGKEEVITYGQLLNKALQVAASLRARGVVPGETVAIMQPTTPLFFYTFIGVQLAGGIPVPIYPPFRPHMIEAYAKTEARILRNAEVRVLVTFEQAEKLSRLLQSFVPSLKHVVTANELLTGETLQQPFSAGADQYAFIQYTSGSTNDPKGVLLTHANLLANIRGYGRALKINSDDVAVSWLPLYHDMGLIGAWLGSLYHGIPLVLMSPFSFLMHPERWLWAIHYHRGTLSGAPNFAYEMCVRKIDHALLEGLDLSSWRVGANGAEKVYAKTLQQFNEKFMPFGLRSTMLTPMYGLAESTVALTIPSIEKEFHVDYVDRKLLEEEKRAVPVAADAGLAFVSCGKPIEGHEIRIVDDEMNVLPERSVGRLQFRGPSSMQGYYHNVEATKAVMHDGWLDSGDLGYIAGEELYIAGRRKDLIIKSGRNLYPLEIEELVGHVPGVRQGCVAVFGVTDEVHQTEKLVVVAETREKSKAVREGIIEAIKSDVSASIDVALDDVVLVAPHIVPKTSSGKLQRSLCKTMYLNNKLKKSRLPASLQVVKLVSQMIVRKCVTAFTWLARLLYTTYVASLIFISLPAMYLYVKFSSQVHAANAIKAWLRVILRLSLCPLKVTGRENLPIMQPAIYVANHASYLDVVVALAIIPANTRFVGKKELFHVPVLRTFLKKLNCLQVDRMDFVKGVSDANAIAELLKEGDSVFIFPEGTFGYASGLRPFRMGAFKMAADAGVPVCPMAFDGVRKILRDGEWLLRWGRINVTVSRPIIAEGTEWQDVVKLRDAVRSEVAKHCGEESLDFIAAQTVAMKVPR